MNDVDYIEHVLQEVQAVLDVLTDTRLFFLLFFTYINTRNQRFGKHIYVPWKIAETNQLSFLNYICVYYKTIYNYINYNNMQLLEKQKLERGKFNRLLISINKV